MASTYQSKIIKELKKDGWLVIKTIRLSESGYPDIFAFKNGVTKFIESKEANDTLKPLQKYRIDELRSLGFDACCMQDGKGVVY